MKNNNLFDTCLGKSAQAWCKESTNTTVMDANLATEFAKILFVPVSIIEELIDIIQWMSGSSDFGPEGEAFDGWLSVREKLNKASDYISDLKGTLAQ